MSTRLPIDSDVGDNAPRRLECDVVLAVALGGVAGAEARYGLGRLAPHTSAQFPWLTLVINVSGCLLIGVLMGALDRAAHPPRLARPLLGTGVLGGFTTFSTFAVDVDTLLHAHRWALAAAYLLSTVVLCLLAVTLALGALARRPGPR